MEIIKIKTPFIKLDQLLKFASIVDSGGVAKEIILGGCVKVNGEIALERGRKIYPGYDVYVAFNGDTFQLKVE